MKLSKKIAASAAAGAMAVAGAGVAFAYWTATGSGTGTASTAAGSNDLSYNTSTLTAMYPGDAEQDLTVTVTNDSLSQNEYVNNVTVYLTTDKAGCTGDDYLLNGSAAPSASGSAVALGWTAQELDANGDSASTSGDTIQFNDKSATNQDACKGATVTLHYSST